MTKIECPCCNQETITLKQKLLTNKWIDIYCSSCGTRFCAQPAILAAMSFLLTWNILYFGYLAIKEQDLTFTILFFAGWVVIELFMYYIPLTRLRAKTNPDTTSD